MTQKKWKRGKKQQYSHFFPLFHLLQKPTSSVNRFLEQPTPFTILKYTEVIVIKTVVVSRLFIYVQLGWPMPKKTYSYVHPDRREDHTPSISLFAMAKILLEVPDSLHLKLKRKQLELQTRGQKVTLKNLYSELVCRFIEQDPNLKTLFKNR